jgi:hypothetical protein
MHTNAEGVAFHSPGSRVFERTLGNMRQMIEYTPEGYYVRSTTNWNSQLAFQDEFRRLCKKYGIVIDERYIWN